MRLYTFTNFYLSPIQRGIQTAHLVHELFIKYGIETPHPEAEAAVLSEWALNHKTIIVLDGGNQDKLKSTFGAMSNWCLKLGLPYTKFTEDSGLNKAWTVIGFVATESIYSPTIDLCGVSQNVPEDNLFQLIDGARLA